MSFTLQTVEEANNPLNMVDALGLIATMDSGGGGGACDDCCGCKAILANCLATAERHLREQLGIVDSIQATMNQLGDRPYVFYPEVNPYNPAMYPSLGWWNTLSGHHTYVGCPEGYDNYLKMYINIIRKDVEIRNLKEKIKCLLDYEDCKRGCQGN